MTAAEEILSRVVEWASREATVRALVLVGSRADPGGHDELADLDVQVYTETAAALTADTGWLATIGDVLLCVGDEYRDAGVRVPTRLVIFHGGVKVDFAFYPAGALSNVTASLPHGILVDKSSAGMQRRRAPAFERDAPPDEAEFRGVVEEFWFEAYHVAKYLARGELWLAKSRDWATKAFLMRMIEWHERDARGHHRHPHSAGKRSAMSEDTWQALHGSFGRFAGDDTWSAAFATMALFRRLATETAAALGHAYPADVDDNLSRLISDIRERRSAR